MISCKKSTLMSLAYELFSNLSVRTLVLFCCSLTFVCPLHAGDVVRGRLYTVPDKIYVNQPFEIRFELQVTSGCEVEDLRISDFPNDQEMITVGQLEQRSRHRVTHDNQAIDLFQYAAQARCYKPIDQIFSPTVQCMLVERRTVGFFSHLQSYPKQQHLDPFVLKIYALPSQGKPDDFKGAIGSFKLTGSLSQSHHQPGDIVTLTLTLTGKGWLGETEIPEPTTALYFKRYPSKTIVREPLRLQTQQAFIPQTTQTLEIATVEIPYFNPGSEKYERCMAGPFHLIYSPVKPEKSASAVRMIDTISPITTSSPTEVISITEVNHTLRRGLPLLVGGIGFLFACFLFFMLRSTHLLGACLLSILVFIGGLSMALLLNRRSTEQTRNVHHQIEARFAPEQSATPLFVLSTNQSVILLEDANEWLRIDANGQRGWIRASALQPEKVVHPSTLETP